MSKKRAFVRYTKSGEIVPGSLIITTNGGYPDKSSLWQEVSADKCCGDNETGVECCNPNERYQTSFTLPGTANNVGGQTVLSIDCNNLPTSLAFTGWALPADTYTIQTYIAILNEYVSPNIATFSWGGGTTVNVEITSCLKDLFCPNGELLISYPAVPP